MRHVDKLNSLIGGQDIVEFETAPEPTSEAPKLVEGILRRWYIVFAIFIIISGLGILAIWLLIKPVYVVTGKIHVAPILVDILTDTRDRGGISDYQSFMNTQAEMVTSSRVVQRVADNLKDRDLAFFRNEPKSIVSKLKRRLNPTNTKPESAWLLKRALIGKDITVSAPRDSELIEITMYSTEDNEATQIVDAFINAYMEIGVNSSTQDEDQKLATLEDERKVIAEKMDSLRKQIYQLAQEYGTATLSGRQDMMLRNVASLMSRVTELESTKTSLKAQEQLLEQTGEEPIAPDELMNMRQQYINRDTAVESMTEHITELERSLIVARQRLTQANPELKVQSELLENMKECLKELKDKASNEFDELLSEEVSKAGDTKLMNVRTTLEQTEMYEKILRETIAKEDEETIRLGRIQLDIQDLQDQLNMTKETYDMVLKRIQALQMQRKRQPRISVHDTAQITEIRDRRKYLSIGVALFAIVSGLWLAYIQDRADLRLRTPEDVAKRIGIRIIGTTTSLNAVKPSLLPQQIIGDYQTIRANLGFLNGEGIPKKLVITSPGLREGKTTFAINLATSLAEAGKKVLLIDGDLRKPDVANLLYLPQDSRGLQDVLSGIKLERAVYSIPSTGLDVLVADYQDAADAYELLALSSTAQRINQISYHYDHVIIDTPPVLAFPDALMWAKVGDAVILTSFAGQTTLPELRETKERLMQINVQVLGTVVSSVDVEYSYCRQDYGYYEQSTRARLWKKCI